VRDRHLVEPAQMNREPTDPAYYRFIRNTGLRPHDFREPPSDRGDLLIAILGFVGLILLGVALHFGYFT
jgi:hypothetical protein